MQSVLEMFINENRICLGYQPLILETSDQFSVSLGIQIFHFPSSHHNISFALG